MGPVREPPLLGVKNGHVEHRFLSCRIRRCWGEVSQLRERRVMRSSGLKEIVAIYPNQGFSRIWAGHQNDIWLIGSRTRAAACRPRRPNWMLSPSPLVWEGTRALNFSHSRRPARSEEPDIACRSNELNSRSHGRERG